MFMENQKSLQILLTLHVANSFVLITANIEDVKKLARKLLSEKFAEQIMQLFVNATSNVVSPTFNVSEENEANDFAIQQASDTEILDQYQERHQQESKLAMQTTASRNVDTNTREVVRAKKASDTEVLDQYQERHQQESKLAMQTTASRNVDTNTRQVVRAKKVSDNEVLDQYQGRHQRGSKLAMQTTASRKVGTNTRQVVRAKKVQVMDQYKKQQGAKLALKTTPSRNVDTNSREIETTNKKVNSKYAESDLRSQESTELSEYRHPLQISVIKPKEETNDQKLQSILRQYQYLVSKKPTWDRKNVIESKNPKFSYYKSKLPEKSHNLGAQFPSVNIEDDNKEENYPPYSENGDNPLTESRERVPKVRVLNLKYPEKKDSVNILRQNSELQYFVSNKPDWGKETIQLSNDEPKKPKYSYHKSYTKIAEQTQNVVAQYVSVNIGGKNIEKNNSPPSENAYSPTMQTRERASKVLDLKYQEKNDRNMELFEKDKGRVEIQMKDTIKQSYKNPSKTDSLHMFIQEGGQLQELTTKREKVEFDKLYEPKKHAQKTRKSKD